MKRARFTDEQIVRILQEADRAPVAEVAKRHGVSEPSIYAWRKKFGDMGTDDVKRLKQLERENNRLKKISAEQDLDGVGVRVRDAGERRTDYRSPAGLLGTAPKVWR
jgi:putative transposase